MYNDMNTNMYAAGEQFREALDDYKRFLGQRSEALNKKLFTGKAGFLDKISIKRKQKNIVEKLEIIAEISRLNTKSHTHVNDFAVDRVFVEKLKKLHHFDNGLETKIISTFQNEVGREYGTRKQEITEARNAETKLINKITNSNGDLFFDSMVYHLKDWFKTSLEDLPSFDLNIVTVHEMIRGEDFASELGLLNHYEEYTKKGYKIEVSGLSLNNIDKVKSLLSERAKKKIYLSELNDLDMNVPMYAPATKEMIEQNITSYQNEVNKLNERLASIGFNDLRTKINDLENQLRIEKERQEREKKAEEFNREMQALKEKNPYEVYKEDQEKAKLRDEAVRQLASEGIYPKEEFVNGDIKSSGLNQDAYEQAVTEKMASLSGSIKR